MSSGEEPISDIDNDIEIIEEGNEIENIENHGENVEETNENEENAEDQTKTVVKPKRVIKNPQPKLNEETLKGPKGLTAIEGYFERVKFKGRGHEEQDLNVLMKTYEYWCHRLFPKFPFDDCIARLEKLGTKKATQTHIKRIRLDINFDDDKPLSSDEGENDTGGFVDTYNDQFDQLLPPNIEPVLEMTEEQLERMRQNKERAQQLREERLKKIREKAQNNLGESSQIVTQSNQDDNIYERSNTYEDGNEFEPSTNVNGNSQNDSDMRTYASRNDKFESRLQQDSGDDEKNTTKRKKRVIESDSENEVMKETNINETVENNTSHNLESPDDELIGPDENDQFENLLQQDDNEERNTSKKKKRVIASDSEDETIDERNEDRTVENMNHNLERAEDEPINQNEKFESQSQIENNEVYTDTLQLEAKNTTREKKQVVESDSEDKIFNKTCKDKTVKEIMEHNFESIGNIELINGLSTNTKDADSRILNCNGAIKAQNNGNGYTYFQNEAQIINSENERENNIEDILSEINTHGDHSTGLGVHDVTLNEPLD